MGAPRECRGPCLLSGLCGEEALVRARALALVRSRSCALSISFCILSQPPPGGGVSSIAWCLLPAVSPLLSFAS
jgi:hypothetical protein